MIITSFRIRGDEKVVLNGDDAKTYHFINPETAAYWMKNNTASLPTLASIAPTTAAALPAAPDVTVTLTGTNFAAASEVLVNEQPYAKTFVSATSMTIVLKPSLVTPPAQWVISVRNAGVFETVTKPFTFT